MTSLSIKHCVCVGVFVLVCVNLVDRLCDPHTTRITMGFLMLQNEYIDRCYHYAPEFLSSIHCLGIQFLAPYTVQTPFSNS